MTSKAAEFTTQPFNPFDALGFPMADAFPGAAVISSRKRKAARLVNLQSKSMNLLYSIAQINEAANILAGDGISRLIAWILLRPQYRHTLLQPSNLCIFHANATQNQKHFAHQGRPSNDLSDQGFPIGFSSDEDMPDLLTERRTKSIIAVSERQRSAYVYTPEKRQEKHPRQFLVNLTRFEESEDNAVQETGYNEDVGDCGYIGRSKDGRNPSVFVKLDDKGYLRFWAQEPGEGRWRWKMRQLSFEKIKFNNALLKVLRDAGTLGTNAQPTKEMIKV
ncbi:hypothetical protein ACLMJK_009395 [Lecanora helva]